MAYLSEGVVRMKEATYTMLDGSRKTFKYDENAPCRSCGLPVVSASMGGTDICSWCDCGVFRDGTKMDYDELTNESLRKKRAKEIVEKVKKGWMPENQQPKCDYVHCMAGMGLVGGGRCFLKGEWWNKKCPQFKRDEEITDKEIK